MNGMHPFVRCLPHQSPQAVGPLGAAKFQHGTKGREFL